MSVRLGNITKTTEALNGVPVYQETVSATTTTKNATAFTGGDTICFQSDVAVYYSVGDSTVTSAAASAFKAAADQFVIIILRPTDTHVAFLPVSGTATVKVGTMR